MNIYVDSNESYPSMLVRRQIRLFNDYASNNSFFRKLYTFIIEFIAEVTFIEVIDLWKCLLNI